MKDAAKAPTRSQAGARDPWGLGAVLDSLDSSVFVGIVMVDGTLVHANQTALDLAGTTLAEVESLDLEPIKFKIGCKEDGYGWTDEHADRIELAYRRFLMLLPVRTGLLLVLKTRTE